MFDLIFDKTNICMSDGMNTLRQNKNHMFESSKYTWLRDAILLEIRALIGLLYMRGLYNINYYFELQCLVSE